MRRISDLSIYNSLNPSELADTILDCPECGRQHQIPFKIVHTGNKLINSIPDVIAKIIDEVPTQIGVVYDRHIQEKLERLIFDTFNDLGYPFVRVPLGEKGVMLEASVEIGNQAAAALPENVDFLIGVGSGVISDLTKWIATKCRLPFLLMGTAASMNAYTSITGSMTEDRVKISKWLDPSSAVLLDSNLLASAPVDMTCAGIADLLARNVANADWKLSELIRGTYFCPVPYRMMVPYQEKFLPLVGALGKNDLAAMQFLGDAILVSGYSMTMLNGETSPSSGSEHIISHFFDFQHEVLGLPKNLHGTQVGVGTIIMSTAFEMLRGVNPSKLDLDDLVNRRLSLTALNLGHKREFGAKGNVFNSIAVNKRIDDIDYRAYISKILEDWDDIWKAVDPFLMPATEIRLAMEKAGAVTQLSGVHRTAEDVVQALLYGSHYRHRYTILDLFWELGLFPELAPRILERAGVLE